MFGASKKSGTGIQFDGDRLRVVELSRGRKGSVLQAAFEARLERPFDLDALAQEERQDELAAALRMAGDAAGIDFVRPCVGLDRRAFFFKSRPLIDPLGVNRRADAENREHLLWEGQQFLGEDRELFCVDCVMAGMQGFVVAVRRRVLDRFQALFARLGIDDLDFDIEPFALFNAGECAGLLAPEGDVLLFQEREGCGQTIFVVDGALQTVMHTARKGEEGRSAVEFAEHCIQQTLAEGLPGGGPQQVWIAGVETEELAEELMTRLGVACVSFPSFASIDTEEVAELPAEESAFAVATGLAYRRCSA